MNKRIKELAEQAGLGTKSNESWSLLPIDQHSLERFAELVRQEEREACAKLCDDEHKIRLAETIRARGEK